MGIGESGQIIDRQQILKQIHRWGSSVIEALLNPSCEFFSVPEIEGLIGYYSNKRCAVVFGDPLCAPDDRAKLAYAFHRECEQKKKNVIYLVASQEFAQWMHEHEKSACMSFGHELFIDPRKDPRLKSGKKGILLRGKVRQASREGVVVEECQNPPPELENALNRVASDWLKGRKGPQVYIADVRIFAERFGKRWFYSKQGENILGVLILNQLSERQGWVLDRVMTVPDAPPGTSELMVTHVLEVLGKEGCPFLTFGPSPGRMGEMLGFGRCLSFFTQKIYKLALRFFHLERKRKYWEKFHPSSTPTYVIFKKPRLGVHEITGLLRALNVSAR